MKKVLSFVIILSMVLSLIALIPPISVSAETSGTCGDNLTWTYKDGTLTISGSGEITERAWSGRNLEIEKVVIEDGIIGIGELIFYDEDKLKEIKLPDSLIKIGCEAFCDCDAILNIIIPDSVKEIGPYTFSECSSLKYVVLNEGITNVSRNMFSDCKELKAVYLPRSLTSIGDYAFSDCENLTDILISGNVKSIGHDVFYNCYNLKSVEILEGVTEIPSGMFLNCINLTDIIIPESVQSIGEGAFACCGFKNINIPDSVIEIERKAFYFCEYLETITIPNELEELKLGTFAYCENLKNVNISESVIDIENGVFSGCRNIENINVDSNNPNYSSLYGTLFNKNKTELVLYPCGKSNLFCAIPDSVESIAPYAFCGAGNLVGISVPDNVTKIEEGTFSVCERLKYIRLPEQLRIIGEYAFRFTGLTEITIPQKVEIISGTAFEECENLEKIYVDEGNQHFKASLGILYNKDMTELVRYPAGKRQHLFSIPKSVTVIGNSAFSYCGNLERVGFQQNVREINEYAFDSCENLNTLLIFTENLTIKEKAFSDCDSLEVVHFSGTEEEWESLDIDYSGNENLLDAYICFEAADKSEGETYGLAENIYAHYTDSISLTIYENKNDSSKTKDSYRLSENAKVSNIMFSHISGKNGRVKIANTGADITIEKDGYLPRKLTVTRAYLAKDIYLQKDEGVRPIFQAVWIDNDDVYAKEYFIDILADEVITLEAEVVWKGGEQKRIYLMQDAVCLDFNNNTLTTVLSDNFDVTEDIYIVAEDSNGSTTMKKLKFKADTNVGGVLNDYKVKFGNQGSGDGIVAENIPVMGGSKVGIDFPVLPIEIAFENNKFYGVVGLDVRKASESYEFTKNIYGNEKRKIKQTTKYLCQNIKDEFTESAEKWSIEKLKRKWRRAKYSTTAKVGFEADCTIIGYCEGYVNSDGEIVFLSAGMGVKPSFSIELGNQILLVPPVYWEAEVKGSIEGIVNLYVNENAKGFMPDGTIKGEVELKGGVGLGVRGVVGGSGGARGKLMFDWELLYAKNAYFALSGEIGAYAKLYVGPVTLLDKNFNWAEGIIWDYPSTRVNSMSLLQSIDVYNLNDYKLVDRGYIENESLFVANEQEMTLLEYVPQNKVETVFKTNVYPNSEPQTVEFSDATALTVWIDDDTERKDINRTALFYSYFDGFTWSEPKQVHNDKTGDFYPKLEVINDSAYLVWVNASSVLENNAEVSEIFGCWDVYAAEFDKEAAAFVNVAAVTENDDIDMLPIVYGDEEKVEIAWVANSSGDIFSEDEVYSVMISELTEEGWSEVEVYSSALKPVDSIDAEMFEGERYVAYSIEYEVDENGCCNKEIYLNNERLTENDFIDSKPLFDNGKLYYYSDNAVVEYDLNTYESISIAQIPTDRFNIISNGEDKAVVFAGNDELIREISAVIYDASSDMWGEAVCLTEFKSDINAFDGVLSQNGEMRFVVNKTEIIGDIESDNPYGATDVVLFSVIPSYNLTIGDVVYHEDLLLSGNTLEFYTEVTNTGELTARDYKVQVVSDSGEVVATTYNEDAILPGQTAEFVAYYPLGDEKFVPHNVTLVVSPMNGTDYDESDNSVEVDLSSESIAIENMGYGLDDEGNAVIYADVVNRGYVVRDDIVVSLKKGGYDGEVIEAVTLDVAPDTLDLAQVTFTVPFEDGEVYCIEHNQAGASYGFIVLSKEKDMLDFDAESGKLMINSGNDIQKAKVIVALYDDDKLVEAKTEQISIVKGENVLECSIDENSKGNIVKIMLWDSLSSMQPICKPYYATLR